MVTSLWFADENEFNLFCRFLRLKRQEIIQIFHERGRILLVFDREGFKPSEWQDKKTQIMKELKG